MANTLTPIRPAPAGSADPAELPTIPEPAGRLAISYTPELIEAATANIPPGSFSVAWMGQDAGATMDRLTLEPGLNFDIDAQLWQRAQVLPSVQELANLRAVEVIELGGPTVGAAAAIKGVEETAALRLVHCCRDSDQLKTWLGIEERHSLRMAIQRKINSLKEGKG